MNRRHTADDYRRTVERLRAARPDLALSSDFIVGFPGESDGGFRRDARSGARRRLCPGLLVQILAAPRHARRCAADQVPEPVKAERLAALQALLREQQRAFNASCVGRVLPVLFEKPGRHPGQLVGRSPYLQAVHAEAAAERIGEIVPVTDPCGRAQQPRRRDRAVGASRMSGLPSTIEPDLAAAGRSQLEFDDNLLLPRSSASATSISTASSGSSASRWCRAATGWRSPGPPRRPRWRGWRCRALYERLKQRPRDRHRRGRCGAAAGAGRNRRQEPQPVARGCRVPHPQAPDRAARRRPGALRQGDARARAGVRPRPRRHRQDLSRGRRRGRPADDRQGRAHHPVAAGGRGRRAARLPAGRSAREGRPLSAAALRRALRHAAGATRCRSAWPAARSRSRRSPSCAGARWRTPSSSSTRRRTRRRCR